MIGPGEKSQKNYFFLLSFLPQAGFWYLEKNNDLKIALIGALTIALIEIILEKIYTKSIHNLSKLNFSLFFILSAISFKTSIATWFKLTPALMAIFCGLFLLLRKRKIQNPSSLPPSLVKSFTKHMDWFFLSYGLILGGLAVFESTGAWLLFKAIGLYFQLAFFLLGEMLWLRFKYSRQNFSNS